MKEKTTEVKGIHRYSKKSLSTHLLYRILPPYRLKHQRWFGWRHTGMLLFPSVHFVGFSSTKMTPFTTLSIRYDEKLNCWFFAPSIWCRLWETLFIQAIFPSDKRVPQSMRWKQRPNPSQMLCNNNRFKPSWQMWKSWLARMKNCKRQWNPKTQNVGEWEKTKMKKSQNLKPTSELELQEKIPLGWRMGFATWGKRWTN